MRQAGVLVVVTLVAVLALRLVGGPPRSWRLLEVGAAVTAGYAGRRIGIETGFIKWVDHSVLERVDEQFDNVDTWLVALALGIVVLLVARAWETARTRGRDHGRQR